MLFEDMVFFEGLVLSEGAVFFKNMVLLVAFDIVTWSQCGEIASV